MRWDSAFEQGNFILNTTGSVVKIPSSLRDILGHSDILEHSDILGHSDRGLKVFTTCDGV